MYEQVSIWPLAIKIKIPNYLYNILKYNFIRTLKVVPITAGLVERSIWSNKSPQNQLDIGRTVAHPNERGSEDQRCVYTVLHGQPSPRPTVPHSLASNAGTTVFWQVSNARWLTTLTGYHIWKILAAITYEKR